MVVALLSTLARNLTLARFHTVTSEGMSGGSGAPGRLAKAGTPILIGEGPSEDTAPDGPAPEVRGRFAGVSSMISVCGSKSTKGGRGSPRKADLTTTTHHTQS